MKEECMIARRTLTLLLPIEFLLYCCPFIVVETCLSKASTPDDSPAFAKFKRNMMPKVGQKITVVGILKQGKQGFWLAFNGWGAYIYAADESGSAKQNKLNIQFREGQTVKVTGTLRYFPPEPSARNDVQNAPEHFFFDAAEVKMSRWSPPSQK